MIHLIDKDALVAEIESLLDKGKYHEEYDCAYRDGNNGALYALKGKVNALEVKEVDIEEEIKLNYNPADGLEFEEYKRIAKYYFELWIKAQKGE